MTDMWRSFVVQRILWGNGWTLMFDEPSVVKARQLRFGRIECGIARHQARNASQPLLVRFDGRHHQPRIAGPLFVHPQSIMIWLSASRTLTTLPNSVGLLALPLRLISAVGSKMLTSFPATCVSPPNTRSLPDHLLDPRHHGVQLFAQSLQRRLPDLIHRLLHPLGHVA